MEAKYNRIIAEIKKAQTLGDFKAWKRWERKLEKWQMEYGAYAPIR